MGAGAWGGAKGLKPQVAQAASQQGGLRPATPAKAANATPAKAATAATPPPAAASSGGINVVGFNHEEISVIVRGRFNKVGKNHGKPTYKKTEQVDGTDVMIYFWDERDGE